MRAGNISNEGIHRKNSLSRDILRGHLCGVAAAAVADPLTPADEPKE
jgi:hypothetical protein